MEKTAPNVVFIFVDDLGYGDISAFNENGKIPTQNVDRLAAEGMCFTDSHACSSLCTPSRYGLLTGRYNWRSRLKKTVLPGDSDPLIEKGRMTLADVFKQAGYRTACVGKWHLGLEWAIRDHPTPELYGADESEAADYVPRGNREPETNIAHHQMVQGFDIDFTKPIAYGPNQYGFDYFYGLPASLDQAPYVYIENDRVVEQPDYVDGTPFLVRMPGQDMSRLWRRGVIAPHFDHERVLDDMNDKVLELIDQYSAGDQPFFLYYPMPAVHGPLLPKAEFAGKSGLNAYADIVLQMDDMVGKVVHKLVETGIDENTLVVFTSDNGCAGMVDFPFLKAHGHNPSYIFRGQKGAIYEGGHRVPTIVRWPGMIEPGSCCAANVCHTDFFRSFADLLGVAVPDNAAEDSLSNLPLWLEKAKSVRTGTVYSNGGGFFSIVRGEWKLICCPGETGKPAFELYNMRTDLSETTNVIKEHPELDAELRSALTDCLERGRTTPGAPQQNFIPAAGWPQINWR